MDRDQLPGLAVLADRGSLAAIQCHHRHLQHCALAPRSATSSAHSKSWADAGHPCMTSRTLRRLNTAMQKEFNSFAMVQQLAARDTRLAHFRASAAQLGPGQWSCLWEFRPLTSLSIGAAVFSAVSPHWAFKFLINHGHMGWVMLGGVLLCVTGAEAMYADLGHFTRVSVQVRLRLSLPPPPEHSRCLIICVPDGRSREGFPHNH